MAAKWFCRCWVRLSPFPLETSLNIDFHYGVIYVLSRIAGISVTLFDCTKMWSGGLLVGHGAALTYPDLPFAKWSYVDGHGKLVARENLPDFMAAADHAYSVLVAWRDGKTAFDALSLPAAARTALENLLSGSRSTDAAVRLQDQMSDEVSAFDAFTAALSLHLGDQVTPLLETGAASFSLRTLAGC